MRSCLRRTLLISADPLSSATIADQARMPVARGDLRGPQAPPPQVACLELHPQTGGSSRVRVARRARMVA